MQRCHRLSSQSCTPMAFTYTGFMTASILPCVTYFYTVSAEGKESKNPNGNAAFLVCSCVGTGLCSMNEHLFCWEVNMSRGCVPFYGEAGRCCCVAAVALLTQTRSCRAKERSTCHQLKSSSKRKRAHVIDRRVTRALTEGVVIFHYFHTNFH